MKKKIIIFSVITAIVITMGLFFLPGVASSSDSSSIVRMYADDISGPWSFTATESTRWVQETSMYNGQTVIIIRAIGDFLWEAPQGTLVFVPAEAPIIENTVIQQVPIFNGIHQIP
jgi:hypothetical protein